MSLEAEKSINKHITTVARRIYLVEINIKANKQKITLI